MKALHFKPTLGLLFIGTALLLPAIAQAQKLPNVQKAAVYAAGPIKIDGKAVELNHKFQAYNKATDCFYTLSNDDTNLYLTVQIKLSEITSKVLMGGMTLTISPARDKKDISGMQITFPLFEGADRSSITNRFARKVNEMRAAKGKDIDATDLNKASISFSKTIRVKGIGANAEETISVYNEQGIKAVAQFDQQLQYTYELQLPLKQIKALKAGITSFKYNVQVNPPEIKPYEPGDGPPPPPMLNTTLSTTDFWGEYTLAKKP